MLFQCWIMSLFQRRYNVSLPGVLGQKALGLWLAPAKHLVWNCASSTQAWALAILSNKLTLLILLLARLNWALLMVIVCWNNGTILVAVCGMFIVCDYYFVHHSNICATVDANSLLEDQPLQHYPTLQPLAPCQGTQAMAIFCLTDYCHLACLLTSRLIQSHLFIMT